MDAPSLSPLTCAAAPYSVLPSLSSPPQARNLARQGRTVAVVEAQNSLGGRSQRNYATTRTGQNVTCAPNNKLCPEGVWWYDR